MAAPQTGTPVRKPRRRWRWHVPPALVHGNESLEGSELLEASTKGEAWKGGPALPASVGLYGSTFYTMTGFHGFHVTMGVLCMCYVLWRAYQGKYTATDHRGVEVVGLYWHFVDLVWIVLFTIVYLI